MTFEKFVPKKVYISGPITGMPMGNIQSFLEYELELTRQGHFAVNPHNIDHENSKSKEESINIDHEALVKCDEIHFLPGWEKVKKCRNQKLTAECRGMRIKYVK